MKSLRWLILALLFAASVVNYVDRQSLSILARTIQDDLHVSDRGYAGIVQAFLFAYMLSFLAAGWITDRLGVRRSMTLFIGWWSVSNLLTGVVGSLRGLAAARFMLGAGESGLYVVAPKVVAQLFTPAQRGLAVGVYSAGATIGATVAPPLIAWLALRHGWRSAFVAGGVLGLLWIVPWLLVYRPAALTPTDLAPGVKPDPGRWRDVFRSPDVLLLLAVRAITDPVWQFILFWFPKYLIDVHHVPLGDVGRIGWVPYLAADVGGILGGYASGVLVARGFRPADARKWVMAACGLLVPSGVVLVPQLRTPTGIVVAMAVVAFAEFTWMVTVTALAVDVLPQARIGRMFGVIAAGSGLGGIVFMDLVGRLVSSLSYTPVFVLMSCLHPLAFICVWLVAKRHATGDDAHVAAAVAAPQTDPQPIGGPPCK